ncbi:MAG TPA: hypothetical protein VJ810_38220 [Blastocatellia bacterium]|nr:hypothetical protein [Blastocatellia bacterium]
MNCQDFETIIIEIARDRLMDAMARERGLEHIKSCSPCASLMVEERALSRDLRALSARDGAEVIPARIETELLSAFRQQAAAPIVAPAGATRRRYWLLAAAAMALLTFGFSLAGWISSSHRRESPPVGSNDDRVTQTIPVATPEKPVQTPLQPVLARQPDHLVVDPTTEKRPKRLPPASARRRSASAESPREYVTQFFPVMPGGELIPLESGQIVRVRMPRSNLIPLGIPFNQERADETIRADVLVSNDGLARAIRFVY